MPQSVPLYVAQPGHSTHSRARWPWSAWGQPGNSPADPWNWSPGCLGRGSRPSRKLSTVSGGGTGGHGSQGERPPGLTHSSPRQGTWLLDLWCTNTQSTGRGSQGRPPKAKQPQKPKKRAWTAGGVSPPSGDLQWPGPHLNSTRNSQPNSVHLLL